MAMDNVHELIYFNPLLGFKKVSLFPLGLAMDNVHYLFFLNPLLDSKKVSPFPRRRVDFKRVGWCHRPRWPWTMPLYNKKKYHHSRGDESTWNGLVGAIGHDGHE
jgi:hypothetical protein